MMFPSIPMPTILKMKGKLLSGSAAITLALAMSLSTGAQAQWAAGISGPTPGGVTVNINGNVTNVNLDNMETLIRWTPTDGAPTGGTINLLPSDSTLNFNGNGNFTVLNQIVDNSGGAMQRLIELNGTVNGYDMSASATSGGNIWFQNAGGILVGSTGVFNVGSLILTSNQIDTTGGLYDSNGAIRFRGDANSGAVTNQGTIFADNASGSSSYVALVAPRIVQTGTVTANGSIAYIAAEQANLTINGGLFDIALLVGANGGQVINHSGTSEVTSSSAFQNIYMASLAKNDAISMLVGGNIGYQAASATTGSDGSILLSSGYDIMGGTLSSMPTTASGAGHVNLAAGRFNGAVDAHASGDISANIAAATALEFSGDARFTGDASVVFSVAGAINAENLLLQSPGRNAGQGVSRLTVNGGAVNIGGNLELRADGLADAATGVARGGLAELLVQNNGSVLASNNLSLSANGYAAQTTTGAGSSGTGGIVRIQQDSGTIKSEVLQLEANGWGSESFDVGSAGGDGRGGTIDVQLNGGSLQIVTTMIQANGEGGRGGVSSIDGVASGAGGLGAGGDVKILIAAGSATEEVSMRVEAIGIGGSGGILISPNGEMAATGRGGNATGGTIDFADYRNSDRAFALILNADASGGDGGYFEGSGDIIPPPSSAFVGGAGGTGQGGSVTALLSGTYDAGELALSANGQGGRGGMNLVGGAGGLGAGGTASLIANNNGPNLVEASFYLNGEGGEGGRGRFGNGGAGGAGEGGTAEIVARGAGAAFAFLPNDIYASGRGGNGGETGISISAPGTLLGGDGGGGTGGTIRFRAESGANLDLASLGSPGPILSNDAIGGDGGVSNDGNGGNGGNAVGGRVELLAHGGTIQQSDQLTITLATSAGTGSDGLQNGQTGTTVGGNIRLSAQDVGSDQGAINLAFALLDASGDSAGRIEIAATNGGAISTSNMDASASGSATPTNNNSLTSTSGIVFIANDGTISSSGNISANTGGSIGVHASGNGAVSAAGDLNLSADDQVEIRHANRLAPAATLASGGSLNLNAGTSIFSDNNSLVQSGDSLFLTANSAITMGRLNAQEFSSIESMNGAVTIDHLLANNPLVVSGQSVSIRDGGDLFFEMLRSYDGPATVQTSGALTIGGANIAGNANLSSTGDLHIMGLSASGTLAATSSETIFVSGWVEAPDISLTSRDIAIESRAMVGQPGLTNRLTLTNSDNNRQTFIGGTGAPNGYHLDAEEIASLYGTNIRLVAPNMAGSAVPDVVIDSFTLDFQNSLDGGSLTIETPGRIAVIGHAALTNMSGSNNLQLNAGEALDVIFGQGSLRITDSSGEGTGRMILNAPRIMVASEAAIADLANATTPEDYENRLSLNDGFASSEGTLVADGFSVTVDEGFFVQNSGDGSQIDARRGISFGPSGLDIIPAANSLIIINGAQNRPNGWLTGSATISGMTINGDTPAGARFNRPAVMNSCLITNAAICGADAFTPTVIPIPPVQDVINNPVTEEDDEIEANDREASSIPDTLISMSDIDPLTGEALVDDPVTATGNDDLWQPFSD